MQKIFVTYFLEHGRVIGDETTKEMEYPVKKFDIPNNCYGFRLWFRNEETIRGEVFIGEAYGHLTVYYGGKVYTLEQVKRGCYPHSTRILIDNMECNQWSHIIATRYGRCLPFNPDKNYHIEEGESYVP